MMAEKIVQTAGRNALGKFAPDFAHFNDDILFGENWNNTDIDLKTLGATEDMIDGIADATLILDGGYKVLDRDEVVKVLKESM